MSKRFGLRAEKEIFCYNFLKPKNFNYLGGWPDVTFFTTFGDNEESIKEKEVWLKQRQHTLFDLNRLMAFYCRSDVTILLLAVVLYTCQSTVLQHLLQDLYRVPKIDSQGRPNLIMPFAPNIVTGSAHS